MDERDKKNLITDFTAGSVSRELLIFAAPLFLSNLLQIVYNMADMIVVGRALGAVGLSAVAVGGDVANFLTFIAMGFSNAGQVIIAQLIGAGQREKLGRFIGTMSAILFGCAITLSVICLFLRVPILRVMNTPESSWEQAMAYATVSIVGLIFIYGYNVTSAVLRGLGDSRHPFIFISIAAVLNVFLDLAFVLGLNLGAGGAALATVMSQGVSFISCFIFLWCARRKLGFVIGLRDFIHVDGRMAAKLIRLGVPMAIKSASVQFSKLFVNSWINSYGVEVSAVAGIANKFVSISNLISNAVNTAGSSMVGQNIGAGQYRRVSRIVGVAFVISFITSSVMAAALLLFPQQIFGFFTSDPAVIVIAMEYLPVAILVFYGAACRAPANALLNGSGNYKINFVTAILDGLILRIGLSLLFGLYLGMGYIGFWLGDSLASFTPFWIGVVYYLTGSWKTRKYVT